MKRPFLHKTKDGYWHIYYYDESGKRHSFTTGETLSGPAKDKFTEFKNNNYNPSKKSKTILSEFSRDYLSVSSSTKTPKTCASIKTTFNEFIRVCSDKQVNLYTTLDVDKFLSRKSKEASVWSARKYRIHLNAAFNKAVEWKIINENPVSKSIKIKKPAFEIIYFEKKDFNRFLDAVDNPYLKDVFITAVLTGLRLSELLRLKTCNINYKNKIIFVESTNINPTKDKESRVIELNPFLIPILKNYTVNNTGDILFPPVPGIYNFYDFIERKFKIYVKKAKLNPKLHFHSLRSTFGMWLLNEGINLKFISQQLGHARISTTEDYYAKYIISKSKGLNKINYK